MILKQGTNFTNLYVVLRSSLCNPGQVWIEVSPIRVEVTARKPITISTNTNIVNHPTYSLHAPDFPVWRGFTAKYKIRGNYS